MGLWSTKKPKVNDPILKDGRKDDIVIPIMGIIGVGKSSFINTAIGRDVTPVGHDLKSCTAQIVHAIVPYPLDPNRRVVLVDTPGFDDTDADDSEILRRVAEWLAHSHSDGMKLAGIIYLHEISQTRMLKSARKNLLMFKKLCGDDACKNIILATTKWGEVEEAAGVSREGQLKNTFWKEMIGHGSRMCQFRDNHESAWRIVEMIAVAEPLEALRIQKELVDHHKSLTETEAGISISKKPRPDQKMRWSNTLKSIFGGGRNSQ
ncbi:P-loop containing nucleoside triphosphate hydrolase protein [Hygrophoropsis aurantiaca]|uniref:P-loop containing nucleoside triphosphate hydrolase protein n=1 Tax=Hygrophoropsis aurantiaca TaxID=72124 RepID=A0ACB7ZZS8_9AGAM|nr:P-loop containing nucleoside triphosphate hydrolase protein [Hygrophoropsis aurantiaca]